MLSTILLAAAVLATGPQLAPPVFVTSAHGLTFRTPPGTTYCPLPEDWVGSDHGTTLFLTPPKQCGSTGYFSSGRGFAPDVPRIEIYYGYGDIDDKEAVMATCRHPIGMLRFVGKLRPMCRKRHGQTVEITIGARYMADNASEVDVALETTERRLRADLKVLRHLLQSIRPCTAAWGEPGGSTFNIGEGAACPADGELF